MNIEEALDRLKRIIDITYTEKFKTFTFMYQDTDAIETLLTAYEKEKEENRRLEARKYMYNAETGEISQIPLNDNYISKDKIKAKIEVMNTNIVNAEKFDCDYIGQCRFAKYVLQSLIEKE